MAWQRDGWAEHGQQRAPPAAQQLLPNLANDLSSGTTLSRLPSMEPGRSASLLPGVWYLPPVPCGEGCMEWGWGGLHSPVLQPHGAPPLPLPSHLLQHHVPLQVQLEAGRRIHAQGAAAVDQQDAGQRPCNQHHRRLLLGGRRGGLPRRLLARRLRGGLRGGQPLHLAASF